jgi:hypothetical protein
VQANPHRTVVAQRDPSIPDSHSNHCNFLFLSDDTISPNHLTHETNHKLNQTLQMSLPSHIVQAQQRIHSGASDASSPFRFLSIPSPVIKILEPTHPTTTLISTAQAMPQPSPAMLPSHLSPHPVPKIVTIHFPLRVRSIPSRNPHTHTDKPPHPVSQSRRSHFPSSPTFMQHPSSRAQTVSETHILASTPQPQRTCLFERDF